MRVAPREIIVYRKWVSNWGLQTARLFYRTSLHQVSSSPSWGKTWLQFSRWPHLKADEKTCQCTVQCAITIQTLMIGFVFRLPWTNSWCCTHRKTKKIPTTEVFGGRGFVSDALRRHSDWQWCSPNATSSFLLLNGGGIELNLAHVMPWYNASVKPMQATYSQITGSWYHSAVYLCYLNWTCRIKCHPSIHIQTCSFHLFVVTSLVCLFCNVCPLSPRFDLNLSQIYSPLSLLYGKVPLSWIGLRPPKPDLL